MVNTEIRLIIFFAAKDGKDLYSHPKMEKIYTVTQRWRSSIQSVKTIREDDCHSNHELLFTKFRLKLKKVGKTTRPFRYDLNKIP